MTDPGFTAALASQARLALDDGDLQLARALVDAGIDVAPAGPVFLELNIAIDAAAVAAEQETERQFNVRIQEMSDEVRQQAQSGRFAPPNEQVAHEMLQALIDAGANPATVTSAREAIAFAYLQMARRARGAGEFDSARTLANLINQHQPDATMAEILRQELDDIDAAQQDATRPTREAVVQQPAADSAREIESLQSQFASTINETDLSLEDGRMLVIILDRLNSLGAGGEIVEKGSDQIAVALLKRALALADTGDWQAALNLAVGTSELLPDSRSAIAVVEMLQRDHGQFVADQSAERTRLAENRFGELMAQTAIDVTWLDEVLQVRGEMDVDTTFEQTSNEQIVAKLAQHIDFLASTEQFSEARVLLDQGTTMWPDNPALLLAGDDLQTAIDEFEQRERQLQARSVIAGVADPGDAGVTETVTDTARIADGGEVLLTGSWQGADTDASGYLNHVGDRLFGVWKTSGLAGRVDLSVREDGNIEGALSQEKGCSYEERRIRVQKICTIQSRIALTHVSRDRLEGTIHRMAEPVSAAAMSRACESCYANEIRDAVAQEIGWQRTDSGIASTSEGDGGSRSDSTVRSRALRRIYYVSPKYPPSAGRRNLTGWVSLEFTVTTVGDVVDIQVLDAKPKKVFDAAAVHAVSQWLFDPAIENYKTVETRLPVRLGFDLQ